MGEAHQQQKGAEMAISKEDLERIRQVVWGELRVAFGGHSVSSPNWSDEVHEAQLHLEQLRQESREWRAEKERLDEEIRSKSMALPSHLRPRPEQYKSVQGKEHVISLLKDPSRWEEIPLLPVQWPSRKGRKATVDPNGSSCQ